MALDSKVILADLADNYWEDGSLQRHLKDASERSKFVWDAISDGQITSPDATNLVIKYLPDARFEPLVSFLNMTCDQESSAYGIVGWSHNLVTVFRSLAQNQPGFLESIPLLIEPIQTLAWMEFFKAGVVKKLPESCLPVLARSWFGNRDDWFYDPYKAVMTTPAFEEQKRLALSHPDLMVGHWNRIQDRVATLSAEEAINVALAIKFNEFMKQMIEVLGPHGDTVLEPITRFVLDHENAYSVGPYAGVLSILFQRAGKQVPPDVIARLQRLPHQYYVTYSAFVREALKPVPQAELAEWIQATLSSPTTIVGSLITVVEDTSFHYEATKSFIEKVGKDNGEKFANNLAMNGLTLLGPLLDFWDDKLPAAQAEVIVKTLQKLGTPLAAETFVSALGHSSKAVRAVAEIGLSDLGVDAKEALEEGAKSKKKAIREFCKDALERLQNAQAAPDLQIDDESRTEIREALAILVGDSYPDREKAWTENEKSVAADSLV